MANIIHSAANNPHIVTNYSCSAANILYVQHPFSTFFESLGGFQRRKMHFFQKVQENYSGQEINTFIF